MIMGLGVGAWTPAVFHIFTHAFFKALLFLGAGSVSHSGAHHSFDMKKDMGGLRKHMPVTFWTFVIGTLALAGIFPFAGFFSKDEILANAGENGYTVFMIVGLVGAFMTAAYMARCVYLTFFGEYRGGHDAHDVAHETPALAHATIGSPPDAEASETDVEAEDYPLEDGVTRSMADAEHEARHELRAAGRDPEAAYDLAEGVVPAAAGTRAAATAVLEHDAGVHGHGAHDAHGAHAVGHGDGHDAHAGPHESGPLLTVPLIILAVLATISGFLLAPAFHTEKFLEWVEPSHLGESFPELAHAPFHWIAANGAVVSLAIAIGGLLISFWLCVRVYEEGLMADFTRRNALARAGYSFLWNKYYLDHLYERVIIAGIKGPIARAAYWINQNVLDGIVNGAGIGAREGGRWVYRNVDQRVVDGIVNGTGLASESTGEGLRPIQSGKVSQYGALLFAAAGVGALILVLVV
jgi:NADH-quinone oxidoreductase subunit L